MTRSEGLEKADKVLAECDATYARIERANDTRAKDESYLIDGAFRARSNHKPRAHHQPGIDLPKGEEPDPYWVWRPSKHARETASKRCRTCGIAKPYAEFDRTPGSAIHDGQTCRECVERGTSRAGASFWGSMRRANVSRHDTVPAEGSRARA